MSCRLLQWQPCQTKMFLYIRICSWFKKMRSSKSYRKTHCHLTIKNVHIVILNANFRMQAIICYRHFNKKGHLQNSHLLSFVYVHINNLICCWLSLNLRPFHRLALSVRSESTNSSCGQLFGKWKKHVVIRLSYSSILLMPYLCIFLAKNMRVNRSKNCKEHAIMKIRNCVTISIQC